MTHVTKQPVTGAALTVTIYRSGQIVWARSDRGGLTNTAYVGDGTLDLIIAALEDALVQAQSESGTLCGRPVNDRSASDGS